MTSATRKRVGLLVTAAAIVAAVVYGFVPRPLPVETAVVREAPMRVIIEEEGETAVQEHYTVYSPVGGYARRIELQPGDELARGQALVYLEPSRSAALDPRTAAEAAGRAARAEAALAQAQTAADLALRERDRLERVAKTGQISAREIDQARSEATQAASALDAARAELGAARAAAATELPDDTEVSHVVRAPASGRVLAIHRRSEGQVAAGEPLLEIGDIERLEVRVDLRSQDAVQIAPGTRVELDRWGGDEVLEASVVRVEQQARAVVSALGVEERRATVTAELRSPPEARRGLGSGYRVAARFIVWEADEVLQVPSGALFRTDSGWAVFAVVDNRAVLRPVEVARRAGLTAQITAGLSAGETVILHPPRAVSDGDRVAPRRE